MNQTALLKTNHRLELGTLLEQYPVKDVHVFTADEFCDKKKITKEPTRTNFFSVCMVTGGEMHIQANFSDYHVKKNELFISSPNVVRHFQYLSPDCSAMGIVFDQGFLSRTGIQPGRVDAFEFFTSQSNPQLSLEAGEVELLSSLLLALRSKILATRKHSFNTDVINHSFLAFLYEVGGIHRRTNGGMRANLSRKEDLVIRFFNLLSRHFKEERSVQYYAELLFVTPKYLTESVKEMTGKTAGEFIDEAVIMEAKILLGTSSLSVSEVADTLHFSDQFFFAKFFKKHAGVTPSDYRKEA
ncbi:MAG TPA: AraC family transcriptional regulator [Chitinophagaceae bacterium]|nr:AraC family transcriptional regulator [Chitinophagaceae bacterium]